MKTIKLPCFGLEVVLNGDGIGSITSTLRPDPKVSAMDPDSEESPEAVAAINAIESLILAHACAGVEINSPAYIEGIETAIEEVFKRMY